MKKKKQKRTIHPGRLLAVIAGFAVTAAALIWLISRIPSGHSYTLVIDPAFGGEKTGFEGYVTEADYARNVADRLAEKLAEDRITVVMSHTAEESMSVTTRAGIINDLKPDMVLSIRADSSPDLSASGMRVYADIPSASTHKESLHFAQLISEAFETEKNVWTGYLYYKPIRDDMYEPLSVSADDTENMHLETWDLMKQVSAPVVIVSGLYVSNEEECAEWASEEGYDRTAELLAGAVRKECGIGK